MKIVRNPNPEYNDRYCLFCKRKLKGHNLFCGTTLPSLFGKKYTGSKYIQSYYLIHISCGYKFLKNLKEPSLENKKTLALLEGKYIKELTLDLIK